jgi:hypothetical protein
LHFRLSPDGLSPHGCFWAGHFIILEQQGLEETLLRPLVNGCIVKKATKERKSKAMIFTL